MNSTVTNEDCMELMARYPDKYFDLAVVDVPYGIDAANMTLGKGGGVAKSGNYKHKNWDKTAPIMDYWEELFRVSKNQIIWGANHFILKIPIDSSCWVIWDKDNSTTDFADCELAWTSFKSPVRKFKFKWMGMLQGDMKNKEVRIHPTQKPIALYKWLLQKYAKAGDKILDTHLGSGSSRIAAYDMGFDFTACELEKDYFDAQEKRFNNHILQQKLFTPDAPPSVTQTKLL